MDGKCSACNNDIDVEYKPMDEWKIKGSICSKCYSQKLEEHYPGEHIRTNRLTGEWLLFVFGIFMPIQTVPC